MSLQSISVGSKKMRKWSMVCNNKWDSVLLATLVSLMLCCVIIHKYGTPNFNGNKVKKGMNNMSYVLIYSINNIFLDIRTFCKDHSR